MIQYLLLDENINEIKKRIMNKTIILFLDYDGTLAPFRDDPNKANPYPGIKQILKELNKNRDIYINIISGRTLTSLNKQINILDINYVGTHGLEMKIAGKYDLFSNHNNKTKISSNNVNYNNTKFSLKNNLSGENILPKIRGYFEYLKKNHSGIEYEDKKNALALHHPPSYQTGSIIDYLTKIIDNTQFEILKGKNVIEVRPRGWHKGKSARYIVKNILDNINLSKEKEHITIYIGDDTTDEDAFKELSGLNIYVKNDANLDTAADYYLNNPKDVLTFLETLKKMIIQHHKG